MRGPRSKIKYNQILLLLKDETRLNNKQLATKLSLSEGTISRVLLEKHDISAGVAEILIKQLIPDFEDIVHRQLILRQETLTDIKFGGGVCDKL